MPMKTPADSSQSIGPKAISSFAPASNAVTPRRYLQSAAASSKTTRIAHLRRDMAASMRRAAPASLRIAGQRERSPHGRIGEVMSAQHGDLRLAQCAGGGVAGEQALAELLHQRGRARAVD